MNQRDPNDDVRVWASSIGSNTIDIYDRRAPSQPSRPLKAGLKLADTRSCLKHGTSARTVDRESAPVPRPQPRRADLGSALASAVTDSGSRIKSVNIDLSVEAYPEKVADAAFLDVLRLLRPLSPDQRCAVLRAVEAYFSA